MKNVSIRLADYKENTGEYPESLEQISEGFNTQSMPIDSWNNSFIYHKKSTGYKLISYGADGKPGGEGLSTDIISLNGEINEKPRCWFKFYRIFLGTT